MIIQQPYNKSLGYLILENLQEDSYNEFSFIVAYAKTSGVNRLLPYMQQFVEKGGDIKGVVGIDQYNTSYEALKSLNTVCSALYVFHSENMSQTFHPKMYSFENNDNFWYSIGSNNMTGGGLFSNYETCFCTEVKVDSDDYTKYHNAFNDYSDTQSSCCLQVNEEIISNLFLNKYIKSEKALILERIKSRAQSKDKSTLFGNEIFFAPQLSTAGTKRAPSFSPKTEKTAITKSTDQTKEGDYLIRFIPKAGNRSKQVHFNMDLLHNYFKLSPSDSLDLQQLTDIYTPSTIEHRIIVFSHKNSNVKIELNGAHILDTDYPTDPNKRPILIMKRNTASFFEYMLLFDGNDGYSPLHNYLTALPKGKSFPYKVLLTEELFDLWDACPLV